MTSNTQLMGPLGVNITPLDYLVSSTITSGVISGGLNYNKVSKGEMSKDEAIKRTIKVSSQAGVATGSTIAAIQYATNKNYLGALLSVAVGVGGVMAIEKVCDKQISKKEEDGNN